MGERTLLVLGLPSTGKTTFLAALWSVLRQGHRASSELRLDRVDGNQTYLNNIRDAWSRCEEIGRTPPIAEQRAEMHLRTQGGEPFTLVFPDLSGETYNEQWERGQCSREYLALARSAHGVLLFVHPRYVNEAIAITQVVRAASAAGGQTAGDADREPRAWTYQMVGTQVRLIELLQILGRPPIARERLPVAVIISAWDCVQTDLGPQDEVTPDGWMAHALPLLGQYLRTNPDRYPARIYGVSAQGGDLITDRARLLALGADSWKRIVIEGPGCGEHDITAPIRWLIDAHGGGE